MILVQRTKFSFLTELVVSGTLCTFRVLYISGRCGEIGYYVFMMQMSFVVLNCLIVVLFIFVGE